jgi:Family of unknown function (DUF6221)
MKGSLVSAERAVVLNTPLLRVLMLGAEITSDRRFADLVGVDPSNMSRLLGQTQSPSAKVIDRMCRIWPAVRYDQMFVPTADVSAPETYGLKPEDVDGVSVFLRARLDEGTRGAENAGAEGATWYRATSVGDDYNFAVVKTGSNDLIDPDGAVVAQCGVEYLEDGEVYAEHIARHDPARVLADLEVKRQIVAECAAHLIREGCSRCERTLRLLASLYANHPDYIEEWRP